MSLLQKDSLNRPVIFNVSAVEKKQCQSFLLQNTCAPAIKKEWRFNRENAALDIKDKWRINNQNICDKQFQNLLKVQEEVTFLV